MKSPRSSLPYMPQLDGLRAFAVFGVMVWHFVGRSELPGYLGVRLFFVLSGFLITRLLLLARERIESGASTLGAEMIRFYVRRMLRLYPALLLFIVICLVFDLGAMRVTWPWHATYLSNVYMGIQNTWSLPTSILWTLSVEEQFYLAWPLFILLAPRRYLVPGSIAAIAFAVLWKLWTFAVGIDTLAALVAPIAVLDTLAMGALLAVVSNPAQLASFGRTVGLWAFVAMLAAYALLGSSAIHHVALNFVSALVFAWIVSAAARGISGLPGRILSFEPIVYAGKISYGIYLFHVFAPRLVGSPVLQFPVSVGLASLSWYLWERPARALRDRKTNSQPVSSVTAAAPSATTAGSSPTGGSVTMTPT